MAAAIYPLGGGVFNQDGKAIACGDQEFAVESGEDDPRSSTQGRGVWLQVTLN